MTTKSGTHSHTYLLSSSYLFVQNTFLNFSLLGWLMFFFFPSEAAHTASFVVASSFHLLTSTTRKKNLTPHEHENNFKSFMCSVFFSVLSLSRIFVLMFILIVHYECGAQLLCLYVFSMCTSTFFLFRSFRLVRIQRAEDGTHCANRLQWLLY